MRTKGRSSSSAKPVAANVETKFVSPHWIASIYAGLGENDAAFEWLDKAVEKRFGPLIYLNVNPIWDNLRSDPRFKTLGQRVGLP
jgi:hypothetical protein